MIFDHDSQREQRIERTKKRENEIIKINSLQLIETEYYTQIRISSSRKRTKKKKERKENHIKNIFSIFGIHDFY